MSQNPWQSDQRFVVFSKNYQGKNTSFCEVISFFFNVKKYNVF